jgi:hypothetical protein
MASDTEIEALVSELDIQRACTSGDRCAAL